MGLREQRAAEAAANAGVMRGTLVDPGGSLWINVDSVFFFWGGHTPVREEGTSALREQLCLSVLSVRTERFRDKKRLFEGPGKGRWRGGCSLGSLKRPPHPRPGA